MRRRYGHGTLKNQSALNQPCRQKKRLKIGSTIYKIGGQSARAVGEGKGTAKLTNGR